MAGQHVQHLVDLAQALALTQAQQLLVAAIVPGRVELHQAAADVLGLQGGPEPRFGAAELDPRPASTRASSCTSRWL
jgi:hypothetical protein